MWAINKAIMGDPVGTVRYSDFADVYYQRRENNLTKERYWIKYLAVYDSAGRIFELGDGTKVIYTPPEDE